MKVQIIRSRGSGFSGGGGGGGGPNFTTSVLENFASMRTLGGHDLWENYAGQGSTGTISLTSAAARFTGQGMRHHVTAGFPYVHFYCNNGAEWAFAKELALTTYTEDIHNRLSYWMKTPSNLALEPNNFRLIEMGTYTRTVNGDRTQQNAGSTHWYHYLNLRPGVWSKIVIDTHPQHDVGGGPSDPGNQTGVNDPTFPYMDALTRFYWEFVDTPSSYPVDIDYSDFKFYADTSPNEDIDNIATLTASYNVSTDLLHMGFCRSTIGGADTTYTVKYSPNDMHTNGFSSGTTLGTSGADGEGDYPNKNVSGTVAGLEASYSGIYLAVQKQGSSTFRQMYLELN